MENRKECAVIGGGASGMVAAIEAARGGATVCLYERQNRLGKKLLATGNGRCNYSHRGFGPHNYHGTHAHYVKDALNQYDEAATLAFFAELGLETIVDDRNRYYPASLQAQAVLDILRMALEETGVRVRANTAIKLVQRDEKTDQFTLFSDSATYQAAAVIVACGGEAAPALGGTTLGYGLLQEMGHQMIRTAPGIVQLHCDIAPLKAANGLKRDCHVTLKSGGKTLVREFGEVLITSYGLSGPPILQCSGHAVRTLASGHDAEIVLDFFPNETESNLINHFKARHAAHPTRNAEQFFVGLLPRLLGQCALKACGLKPQGALNEAALEKLARRLHAWRVPIKAGKSFADAQVTLGGIDTADFDSTTMGSYLMPGLYACGEVLDIDGDCGGYNLQWAWSSGRLAGRSASEYIEYFK